MVDHTSPAESISIARLVSAQLLIYFSVNIWRTIHPKATVITGIVRTRNGMGTPLLVSFITFAFLFLGLLEMRMGLERARARVDELHREVEDAE
jgi:predicted small integral membrane protein